MAAKSTTVICEPFELDRAQVLALICTVADSIAEDLIRDYGETGPPANPEGD